MSVDLEGRVDLGRFSLDVAIRAESGHVLALLGPNGCGKSTTLAAVAGLRRLSSGTLSIDGTVVDAPADGRWVPPHRRRVGFVFQHLELFPHLSALDNVAYGLRRRGHDRATARRAAREWLDLLGVGDLTAARPATLSGGQAQRVALARALAIEPDVLLLDEPMSALDAESRLAIRGELRRRLAAFEGVTLLVTHDIIDVVGLADRVVVLDDGKVVQDASPEELRRHPLTSHAAALVGRNVLRGRRANGVITLGEGIVVPAPGPASDGLVDVVCSPAAVLVTARHRTPPAGAWLSTLVGIEAVGDHARAHLDSPEPLIARLPLEALNDGLTMDSAVWVWLDPRLLDIFPAREQQS